MGYEPLRDGYEDGVYGSVRGEDKPRQSEESMVMLIFSIRRTNLPARRIPVMNLEIER